MKNTDGYVPAGKLKLFQKLAEKQHITMIAFGSSNTQRRLPGMTWFDYVELGFKSQYGKDCGTFINTGIGGDTADLMLARIDRDVLAYKPDLVIVTVGGNDSNPALQISHDHYHANLLEIHRRIADSGAEVMFQTYYALLPEKLPPEMIGRMDRNMQIVRETAVETGSFLQDNYRRWNRLRERFPDVHALLMQDGLHVTADGNAVIGADLLRSFGISLPPEFAREFSIGRVGQALLDALEPTERIQGIK